MSAHGRYFKFKLSEWPLAFKLVLYEADGREVPRGFDADADAAYAEVDAAEAAVDRWLRAN